MASAESPTKGEIVSVIYVSRRDAKDVKTKLEQGGRLNKDFRMIPSSQQKEECIAVPILNASPDDSKLKGFMGFGSQYCPYSSSLLGNHNRRRRRPRNDQPQPESHSSTTLVQSALLTTAGVHISVNIPKESLLKEIYSLNNAICPTKLELLGDDGTLVIPLRALNVNEDSFRGFLARIGCHDESTMNSFMEEMWNQLATLYKSPRIVRKGKVDPDSCVRESGYRLVWPAVISGTPDCTGPGSPGWITVTEQGIRQSFDLSRVMFSRGNVTEKIRFGHLVQPDEMVLDLYAGIGYFTLPAIIHGKAKHVFACEWNDHAVEALRFNLRDNDVVGRATVLVGDCRTIAEEHKLVNMFDRVSLGLLPSSEGGWQTAVKALRRSTGGWLHVHGNVPVKEADAWRKWVCVRLREYVRQENLHNDWIVVATHLEKVKSFAPTICHYVLDIYVGPNSRSLLKVDLDSGSAGVLNEENGLELCPSEVDIPSCALSPDGVLHQSWMR